MEVIGYDTKDFDHRIETIRRPAMAINRELLNATLDVIRQSLQADGGDVELIDVPGVKRVQPAML